MITKIIDIYTAVTKRIYLWK